MKDSGLLMVAHTCSHPPLWLLVLVTFSGTLAMHMFVPALTTAARDLGTSAAAIQMTISLYVLGLAFGQLVYGPLSDRYGRRPTLMAGLALYTVAGVVCMLASSVEMLVAARFAQALGGCSGLLLARAIVRDTANAEDTLRRLALVSLMTMVGPGLSPLMGGFMAASLGWRPLFAVFVALGLAGLALSWRLLPETRRATPAGETRSTLSADYGLLLRSPAFVGCVIGGGCATTGFYAFVAAAPFIFVQQLHQPLEAVGVYLCLLIVGMSTGNLLASRLIRRTSLNRLMVGANAVSVLCTCSHWTGAAGRPRHHSVRGHDGHLLRGRRDVQSGRLHEGHERGSKADGVRGGPLWLRPDGDRRDLHFARGDR